MKVSLHIHKQNTFFFLLGSQNATKFSWTGIQFKMCLTPLPYFKNLIQKDIFSDVRSQTTVFKYLLFLSKLFQINLPSKLVPSEVKLKRRADYIIVELAL